MAEIEEKVKVVLGISGDQTVVPEVEAEEAD
jgi:hypothetical protein